jgi:hypothetical protein
MSGIHRWRWNEEQPGVIVIVVLVLAFALLFPHNACRGRIVAPGPPVSGLVSPGAGEEAR